MDIQQNEEEFTPHESLQLIADMIDKAQNDKLRRVAKKRVGFKVSFAIAVLVNVMLICIWYFTTGLRSYFWPLWPMLVWGVALLIQFSEAYLGTTIFSEDKEYDKLKKSESSQKRKFLSNN